MNHHRAKKSLGQNFLVDANYQRKIAQQIADLGTKPVVVEIGPGQGAITQHLLPLCQKLVLVEKDFHLAADFEKRFADEKNVVVRRADFLELDLDFLKDDAPVVAVGNLPYNVASQILIRLFENGKNFSHFFLMFQREMAERIVAIPGSKDYGVISIWSRLFSNPKILFHLPPSVFRPQPKVQSSFVRFDVLGKDVVTERGFIDFIRLLFQQRRKKIGSVLKRCAPSVMRHAWGEGLLKLVDRRPEELSIEELKQIYQSIL